MGSRLGWESLSNCRKCRRVLQIHNIFNNKIPSYLKDKLPPNCRALFNGNIRNTFCEIICKSNRYMNIFFPDAISSWDIFIKHFNDIPSFHTVKEHINTFFRPKSKSSFGIHDPVRLRFLFQLRVSLSPLRSHKRSNNFVDTSSEVCQCNQGVEDPSHLLFPCPCYVIHRATLVGSVNILRNNLNLLANQVELYLYGHRYLNSTGHKKYFC